MHSKDIRKFILSRTKGNFKIIFVDGNSIIGSTIEGLKWNAGNHFNMWVIRDNNGFGVLIDGNFVVSIASVNGCNRVNKKIL